VVDLYLKSAIEGVVIKWATQINDVLTQESSQAFDGGQNPTPSAGIAKMCLYINRCSVGTVSRKHKDPLMHCIHLPGFSLLKPRYVTV
jgi:hypothetical protein